MALQFVRCRLPRIGDPSLGRLALVRPPGHACGVSWIPPRGFGDRTAWAHAHPWIAASYWATMMSLFVGFLLPTLIGSPASLTFRIVMAAASWPLAAVTMAIALKRRLGERPGC